MPIPVIVWGIIELVGFAITAYETYDILNDLYEDITKYSKNLDAAKKEVAKMMEALKKEIAANIDEKTEVAFLSALTAKDPQGEVTRRAQQRGAGNAIIEAAIKQKIPFRQVVSMVCDQANKMPVINLRKKKGVTVKDLPKTKKDILAALVRLTAEELANVDLDEFILVRLKQLATSLIFEFMDELVDWKSPLKAEVCYNSKFEGPKIDAKAPTKLNRVGSRINPFYPMPYRERGAIAADLIITEYRKKPATIDNIFALIEIKFQNDRIEEVQFRNYGEMSDAAGKKKNSLTAKTNTHGKQGVIDGFKVSLFRYPEDKAVMDEKEPTKPSTSNKKGKR